MIPFDKALYEGTMVAFAKVLSRYNAFAQSHIMREVGAEIIDYLKEQGHWFEETGTPEDISKVVELFMKNGFASNLEVSPAEQGETYVWHDLLLLDAYHRIQEFTDNPFLSCPLNLCLNHVCDENNKVFKLHSKTFEMDERVTISNWELAEKKTDSTQDEGFDPLVIENAHLVEIAEQRAEKLEKARKEIEAAKDAADRESQAKSALLANMSHEIRNPMNGIIGMTQLLNHTKLDHEQKDYLETIDGCSEALMRIVNDILDLSKLEVGKIFIESADFHLQTLLDEAVSMLCTAAQNKGVDLVAVVDPGCPLLLKGDAPRLRQVLVNLVSNALKYTNQGSVIVRVSCSEANSGQPVLHFSVKDTGSGIPADRIPDLFMPYSQPDPAATRRLGGTGLGLSISQRLVQAMGGNIMVESSIGVGSCFFFNLQLPLQNTEEIPRFHSFQGAKTLLIEPDDAVRKALLDLLWHNGMDAVACGSIPVEDSIQSGNISLAVPFEWILVPQSMLKQLKDAAGEKRSSNARPPYILAFGYEEKALHDDCGYPCIHIRKPLTWSGLFKVFNRTGIDSRP